MNTVITQIVAMFGQIIGNDTQRLKKEGLIYNKVHTDTYILENILVYYNLFALMGLMGITALIKRRYLLFILILAALLISLYIFNRRWRRLNHVDTYGYNTAKVISQYPHQLTKGDYIKLFFDDPPITAGIANFEQGMQIDKSVEGLSIVEKVINENEFLINKRISPTVNVITPGWWKKI